MCEIRVLLRDPDSKNGGKEWRKTQDNNFGLPHIYANIPPPPHITVHTYTLVQRIHTQEKFFRKILLLLRQLEKSISKDERILYSYSRA